MGRGVGSRIEARARREELQQKLVMREMGQEREKKKEERTGNAEQFQGIRIRMNFDNKFLNRL